MAAAAAAAMRRTLTSYGKCLAILAITAALAGCELVGGTNPVLAGQDVHLTIFHTSDIHSRLLPYDQVLNTTDTNLGLSPEAFPYGGAARLRSIYLREKAKVSRSILLDSGDCFEGSPLFNVSNGEPEFRFMSLLHPDAAVVGNHEFDKGALNFAEQAKKWVNYPLLVSNYIWGDPNDPTQTQLGAITKPFTLVNAEGLRIAVLGMGNLSSLANITQGGNSLGATAVEDNELVRSYVGLLAPISDLIVILSHLGLTEDEGLLTGYDTYFPYASAKPFLERADSPWMIEDILPPRDASEADNARQPDGTVKLSLLNPNRQVHVFIPPVEGIDVIMGGHLHIVLQPANQLSDSVVQRIDLSGKPVTDLSTYQRNPDGSDRFQVVPDPNVQRGAVIVDSGAFSKYLGRFDTVIRMPPATQPAGMTTEQYQARLALGGEVVAQTFNQIPIDSLWCLDPRPIRNTASATFSQYQATVEAARALCAQQEDPQTLELLENYTIEENTVLQLPRVFAYTPNQINRIAVAGSSAAQDAELGAGGDSQLGNLVTQSMRIEPAVGAEFGLTNSLGIRDNIYPGPINLEQIFNVFPFENTLTIQFLSGREVQLLLDFVTDVSASRGCSSQAQVSGLKFVQDCGRSIHNTAPSCDNLLSDGTAPNPCAPVCRQDSDCLGAGLQANYGNAAGVLPPGAQYFADTCAGKETSASDAGTACFCNQGLCYAYSAHDIQVNGEPLALNGSYKSCVNDYIAKGGSGFRVLQINTSKVFTGISMRDALISYMENGFCQCDDILAGNPTCARLVDNAGNPIIDPSAVDYCNKAKLFEQFLSDLEAKTGLTLDQIIAQHPDELLAAPAGVSEGKCECARALAAQVDPDPLCGHVTAEIKAFCRAPSHISVVSAEEDSRIEIKTQ